MGTITVSRAMQHPKFIDNYTCQPQRPITFRSNWPEMFAAEERARQERARQERAQQLAQQLAAEELAQQLAQQRAEERARQRAEEHAQQLAAAQFAEARAQQRAAAERRHAQQRAAAELRQNSEEMQRYRAQMAMLAEERKSDETQFAALEARVIQMQAELEQEKCFKILHSTYAPEGSAPFEKQVPQRFVDHMQQFQTVETELQEAERINNELKKEKQMQNKVVEIKQMNCRGNANGEQCDEPGAMAGIQEELERLKQENAKLQRQANPTKLQRRKPLVSKQPLTKREKLDAQLLLATLIGDLKFLKKNAAGVPLWKALKYPYKPVSPTDVNNLQRAVKNGRPATVRNNLEMLSKKLNTTKRRGSHENRQSNKKADVDYCGYSRIWGPKGFIVHTPSVSGSEASRTPSADEIMNGDMTVLLPRVDVQQELSKLPPNAADVDENPQEKAWRLAGINEKGIDLQKGRKRANPIAVSSSSEGPSEGPSEGSSEGSGSTDNSGSSESCSAGSNQAVVPYSVSQ